MPYERHGVYWQQFDPLLGCYAARSDLVLVSLTGQLTKTPLKRVTQTNFELEDDRLVRKLDCIGAFYQDVDEVIASRGGELVAISNNPLTRYGTQRFLQFDRRKHIGAVVGVDLANGWRVEGLLGIWTRFTFSVKVASERWVHLFRHAVINFEVLQPQGEHPESARYLDRYDEMLAKRKARRAAYAGTRTRKPKAKTPAQAKPAEPEPLSGDALWAALSADVERTVVNAKIKVVMREVPEAREVGKLVWFALSNQPKGVPGGVELEEMALDLVVTGKMWRKTVKKADKIREDTGREPIHVIEAMIGMRDGKLVSVASGIQVMESKPPKA